MSQRPTTPVRWVALLRGVNVGGRNRLAMSDLRACLTGLGCTDVQTHLQSGNAVFVPPAGADPAALGAALEARIDSGHRLRVPVLMRTGADLDRVIAEDPFGAEIAHDDARRMVAFTSTPVEPGRYADVDPADHAPDSFALGRDEIYLWFPDGSQRSRLTTAFFDRRQGGVTTVRNWRTVVALRDRALA